MIFQRGAYTSLLMDNGDRQASAHTLPSVNAKMPLLTITPALSGSLIDSEDDENTPLVSNIESTTPDINFG